jgi:hypothetical protein
MNPEILHFYDRLIPNIALGIFGLIVVLVFHGGAINRVLMRFERLTKQNITKKKYNRVFFHFYSAFIFIAIIHIFEILLWATFMLRLDLVNNPVEAFLFAGSCYTTVGFVTDLLPVDWKSLALFISFTGLFSFAWTTSIMIDMTSTYKNAWQQKYGI